MAERFDLVVIGTGAAALSIAYPCRSAGWRVAVVDSRPYGGTCVNRGCDPKKVLVGGAEVVDWARRMHGRGVRAADLRIDWPELMRFKRTFTDPIPERRERELADAGIDRFHGVARFLAEDQLAIGEERVTAEHFAIAAGAAAAPLGIPGEDKLISSDDFLELERLPGRLSFVGGGYIAFEFAHLAVRAGAQVTILHRGKRPLEKFDDYLVGLLVEHSRGLGIDVKLSAPVQRVDQDGAALVVHAGNGVRVEADAVVHAAGRIPNLDALRLDIANVASSARGVTVNEFLQSPTNPRVYAAGDCAASGPPLTPVAGYEARIVADNLLHGNRRKPDYNGCASAVFSLPPLAAVGLTEEEAQRQKLGFEARKGETSQWYSSRRIGEECSGYKILIERETNRILGAHLLGQGSEEMINIFALAIKTGLRAEDIRQTLFAYPTHGSNAQYML
jgi:glutathione reductase (NADPH)